MKRALATMFVVVGAGVVLRWSSKLEQPPPPRVSSMAEAPPDEHAGIELAEVMASVAAVSSAHPATRRHLGEILRGEGPPAPENLDAWRPYANSLDRIDRVLARPGLSLVNEAASDAPNLLPLPELALALAIRAWSVAVEGNPERAVADVGRGLALSSRVAAAGTDAHPVAIAVTIHTFLLAELAQMLEWSGDQEAYEEALAELLRHPPGLARAARRIVRGECASGERRSSGHYSEPAEVVRALGLGEAHTMVGLPAPVVARVIAAVTYDRADVVLAQRAWCDELEALSSQTGDRRRPSEDSETHVNGSTLEKLWNPTATLVTDFMGPPESVLSVIEHAELSDAAHSVLTVVIAARLYLAEVGRPPQRPEDLVPGWLPALQSDPFGDLPIRVDGESVWSAGEGRSFVSPWLPTLVSAPRLAYPVIPGVIR